MDVQSITAVIANVGFPIAMCCLLGYYIKYTHDDHRQDIQRINDMHDREVTELSQAVNNNTLVMQKLIDKVGSDEDVQVL